jgi:hypothetical protein
VSGTLDVLVVLAMVCPEELQPAASVEQANIRAADARPSLVERRLGSAAGIASMKTHQPFPRVHWS